MTLRRFLTTDDLDSFGGGGGGGSSSSVYWKDAVYEVQNTFLNVATDPDEIIAAPGANKAIVVLHCFVTNSGTANVEFTLEDDAGAFTHTITAGGNGGGGGIDFGVQLSTNDALNVNISSGTATDLGITVFYIVANV